MEFTEFHTSFLWMTIYSVIIGLLYVFVPGPIVTGYVCDSVTNRALIYKLNGFRIWGMTLFVYPLLHYLNVIDGFYPVQHFWSCCISANVLGLVFSFYFFFRGLLNPKEPLSQRRALTSDQDPKILKQYKGKKTSHTIPGLIVQFFSGFEFNPRISVSICDAKMFLYIFGAALIQIILLSAFLLHLSYFNTVALPMGIYFILYSYWCGEYCYHEHVHLYTYDFFAERLGFKLIWGCFCFYPFFYTIPVWPLITLSPHTSLSYFSLFSIPLFLFGYILSRGANNQKYNFKTGLVKYPKIAGTNLMISGFWGMSRHINYLGEIIMALGLSLPGGIYSFWPWMYVVYYIVLLLPREAEDSRICEAKYGKDKWAEYCKQVPFRIIPYIY